MSAWKQGDSCVTRRHEIYLAMLEVSGYSCWFIAIVRAWNAVVDVNVVVTGVAVLVVLSSTRQLLSAAKLWLANIEFWCARI